MKTHRHLDTLLDSVRENPPVERLVQRDEVAAMLDAGHGANVAAPASRRRSRAALVAAALVVAGGLWFFVGGDDPVTPRAPEAAGVAGLRLDAGSGDKGTDGAYATSDAASDAMSETASEAAGESSVATSAAAGQSTRVYVPAGSRRAAATSDGSGVKTLKTEQGSGARARGSGESPFFLAEKLTVNADGSMELNPPDEGPVEKPEIPSGGVTFTRTELDSAETAALAAADSEADSASTRLDIKRLGYIELTAEEAARLGITVSDEGLVLQADDMKDAQVRYSDSDDRISLNGSVKGADALSQINDGSRSLKRFKLEVVHEMTKFAAVEVDIDAPPLRIAPIVIVNQRRWDLRNEGSSLIFFKNAPTLAAYEGDAVLREEPLEAFRSATRSIGTIDGINRAMSHVLGRLVPVYFRFDEGVIDGTSVRRGADICLWYAPTKEFIEALPHRYRSSLENELSAICEVQEKNGSVEEACDRIAGRPSFLELCRVSSGAVNAAMASPNPAHGRTTIGFRLTEARAVSVTLHDVGGRYLRHLLREEERDAGEQRIEADLNGVGQGAYLVAVRTDRGEQAVARLIVQ